MISNLYLLVVSIVLTVVATAIGRGISIRIIRKECGLIPSYFLGQVLISTIFIIASVLFIKPLNTIISIGILTPLVVIGIKKLKFPKIEFSKPSVWQALSAFFLTALLIFSFFRVFNTPVAWDDVVYHHPVVKEIAQGRVNFPLLRNSPFLDYQDHFSLLFGSLPYASEAYSAFLFSLSGGSIYSSQLINFINIIMFGIFLLGFLKKEYSLKKTTSYFLLTTLLLWHEIFQLTATGYVDLTVVIYEFLALLFLFISIKDKKEELLLLSAIFLGYSFAMKYTAIYLAVAYFFILSVALVKRKLPVKKKTILVGLLLGLLSGGFWYFKNIVTTGNPTYPFYLGHNGFSEFNYNVMILQTYYHVNRTLTSFVAYCTSTYFISIPVLVLLIIGFYFDRKQKYLSIIFLSSIFLLLTNYFIGSQISRFELLFPIAGILLIGIVVNRISILLPIFYYLIFSSWVFGGNTNYYLKHTFERTMATVSGGKYYSESNINCLTKTYDYLNTHNGKAISFWDPYAAVFYSDKERFINFKGSINHTNIKLQEKPEYLYINSDLKKSFLEQKDFHADIFPEERAGVEEVLLERSSVVFQESWCILYKIK